MTFFKVMDKDKFINRSWSIKQSIADDERKVVLLNKKLNTSLKKRNANHDDQELILSYQFEIKEFHLKLASKYLLINRLSEQYLQVKSESSIEKIRKNLVMLVGLWEKEFGESLNNIANRDYLESYRNLKDNIEMIQHFKLFGFFVDKLIFLVNPGVKWYWAVIDLKVRMLVAFCNVIDFKMLLREFSPESKNFHFYENLVKLLIFFSQECIDFLWQKHHSVEEKKRMVTEIQQGLNILEFFIHFGGLIGDDECQATYKKKKNSWKNYRENLLKKKSEKKA